MVVSKGKDKVRHKLPNREMQFADWYQELFIRLELVDQWHLFVDLLCSFALMVTQFGK
jgi:hypothetical protein